MDNPSQVTLVVFDKTHHIQRGESLYISFLFIFVNSGDILNWPNKRAFEHDLWSDLIAGNFEILQDPITENPGSAYSPGTLTACRDISTTLFDMESGVGKCFQKSFMG